MAALHPVVSELLDALKRGPTAGLATLVEARITQDRADRLRFADGSQSADGFIHSDAISEGLRALDMAGEVVVGRLKRELQISQRLQKHIEIFELSGIIVLPTDGVADGSVDLTDPARTEAITNFLEAWKTISGQAREAILVPEL